MRGSVSRPAAGRSGRRPLIDEVNRDFCFLLNAYDIEPGAATPKIMTMTEFNLRSWNSRIFPGIDSLNVRLDDGVRIRIGNLTMTNNPIHLHGHEFQVTGTDGGPTPKGTRWHEVTTDIGVGQMRPIEFVADEEGDWALHCHKSHHTMNAMGRDVPTLIGVDRSGLARQITQVLPDYMVMGERGMDGPEYGGRKDPYDVLLISRNGSSAVYQAYR
jgi:manganese oxidase